MNLKSLLNLNYLKTVLTVGLILCVFSSAWSQEGSPFRTRLSLSCTQIAGGKAELKAKLLARVDKKYQTVKDAEVNFYNTFEEDERAVGTSRTDHMGIAKIEIEGISNFMPNEDGYKTFYADYAGNDQLKASDGDIEVKDILIEVESEIIDSIKTISFSITDENSEEPELEDLDVMVLVPRWFSQLQIAEGTTDEDGYVELEIPDDIAGDENGNLDIILRIEDTDEYGNLEARLKEPWGVKKEIIKMASRKLWSPNAPIWMVMTFVVLMVVVWAHFIYIFYGMLKVKKEGDKFLKLNEN